MFADIYADSYFYGYRFENIDMFYLFNISCVLYFMFYIILRLQISPKRIKIRSRTVTLYHFGKLLMPNGLLPKFYFQVYFNETINTICTK